LDIFSYSNMFGEHRTTTARRRARQLVDFERRMQAILGQGTSISIESRPTRNTEEAFPSEMDAMAANDDTSSSNDTGKFYFFP